MQRRDFLSFAAASPLLLASERESNYTICISRDASPSELRGARELQHYLKRMCGVSLQVATDSENPSGSLLLVGRSDMLERVDNTIPFEDLGNEGFALKTSGPHVIIAGGRLRGTMYGVSTFLEKLGCRWYAEHCTRVPKLRALHVQPMDEIQKPAFEYRDIYIEEATGKDWAANNKTNGHAAQLDKSTGGKITFYPWSHSFYALIPPEKYFGPHPEYFALVDGARKAVRAQLCLSNPNVLRIATETVLKWAAEHPEATFLSVSENDADGPCECRFCRRIEEEEGAHSGLILRFVNSIAAEVARKYPDKLVTTLAYRYSEVPPLKVRPAPNVRIRLALSGFCNGHPYEHCPYSHYSMGLLKAWTKITDRIYVWHYMTDFHQQLLPYPNFDELLVDMAMYHRRGVKGLFLQGALAKGGGGEFAQLRSYFLAKLLWNSSLDGRSIVREFSRAFYGPAAPTMEKYIDWTHREVRFPPRGRGQSIYMYATADFAQDFVREGNRLFDKMEASTQGERFEEEARRVKKERLAIDSVALYNAKGFVFKDDRYGPVNLQDFWSQYERFLAKLHSFGITQMYLGDPLEVMDQEYRLYVKSYETAVIENPSLRVVAVPGYQGRVMAILNKRTGQNAVRISDPDERFPATEALGGLVLFAYPEFYSRHPYPPDWSIASHDGPRKVVLQGVCPNGLRLSRTLSVAENDPILHTDTVIRNDGTKSVTVTLESRIEVNPGDRQYPTVNFSFPRRDGTHLHEQVLPPVKDNYGDEFFHGQERPAGEWSLINPSRQITLTNRFSDDQAARCRFWWRGRSRNTVVLSLWSPKRTLVPEESMTFKTDYLTT